LTISDSPAFSTGLAASRPLPDRYNSTPSGIPNTTVSAIDPPSISRVSPDARAISGQSTLAKKLSIKPPPP